MDVLYLLRESNKQEEFKTKVKYLYKDDFIIKCVNYLDNIKAKYLFLSNNYGILNPNDLIEPYNIKLLSKQGRDIWSVCVFRLIKEYMDNNGCDRIIFLIDGDYYLKLEKYLAMFYEVDTPLKYFIRNEHKIKYIDNLVLKHLKEKLGGENSV